MLTEEEFQSIQADIKDMVTPSWLSSIPANLGEPSHGKLKADQWRTLGTTYLPSSVIRLWHKVEADDEWSVRCNKMLLTTLSLVSAILVASSRTMSHEKADLYLYYMKEYLNGIHNLIPDYQFRPNHHIIRVAQ